MASTGDKTWYTSPPYQSPDKTDFECKLEGECHCGKIRYWLSRDKPLTAKYCHCTVCQRIHGAPFQWAAIFHKSDFAFEKGTEGLHFYHAETQHAEHKLPCKVSCENCGSLIMDEGRNMVLLFPTLIKWPDKKTKKDFYPQSHIFYNARVVDIPDGMAKWSGLDGQSEKLDLP